MKKIYETGETVAMAMAEAGRLEDAAEFQLCLIEQAEAWRWGWPSTRI